MEPFTDTVWMFMIQAAVVTQEDRTGEEGDQSIAPGGEVERVSIPRLRPRNYRCRRVLADFSEKDVIKNFHLSSRSIHMLYDLMEPDLEPRVPTNHAVSGMSKLLAALHYFASGTFQPVLSQTVGFSQPTLSRILTQVCTAFRKLTTQFIHFPSTDSEWREVKLDFFEKSRFPNVLGAIDCTHVAIAPPRQMEECFRNRKSFHSLNVQMVCDAKLKITNLFVGFPGSAHDSFILSQSSVFRDFEDCNMPDGWLLVDGGYPNKSWLLTPLSNPDSDAEHMYQKAHITSRGVIERTFGVLKSRFRCLDRSGGTLLYSPDKVCNIVNACCILHNICVANRYPENIDPGVWPDSDICTASLEGMNDGGDTRQTLIDGFFTEECA
ncbi:putative nuclease HARBI1 [Pseudophryne corroboree]|uniref:putative nuclease HARBI1 n=1 Tax=Pseudophryne corroboree TaxID=495146 RepID=UPI003082125C